jgi:hypothetical protein
MKPEMSLNIFGSKVWQLNGEYHREDGPAFEKKNGYKSWWLNGQRHRTDGPAVVNHDGEKEWWLNGYYFEEEQWLTKVLFNKVDIKIV